VVRDGERTGYTSTEKAAGYIETFTRLYQSLFDRIPGFRL